MQIIKASLQHQPSSPLSAACACACEARAAERRLLLGVGEGKLVAAGTDIGLRPAAQCCLDVLLDRARTQEGSPSLNLVPITGVHAASDCVRYAVQLADDGDILFFVVEDSTTYGAVMAALSDQNLLVRSALS